MRYFNTMRNLCVIGALASAFIACTTSGDESVNIVSGNEGNKVISDVPTKVDSIKEVDPKSGDTVVVPVISDPFVDSLIGDITEAGDTLWLVDTIYVPRDTLVRWVGNSALRITEVVSINMDWFDEDGDDPAWVEIYNAGDEAADLRGYYLVESLDKTRKWAFGNEVIKPHSFRNVFISKKDIPKASEAKDVDDRHYRTHTNWKLDKNGGTIYLIDKFYGIRDSVKFPVLEAGMSWGRIDGGSWKFMDKPTPEAPNTEAEAYMGIVSRFNFDGAKAGFYNDKIVLKKPNLTDGTKIRCTTNGSVPSENSPEFNSDMTIEKNTVLRCSAYKDGYLTKEVVTNSYFINEQVRMPVVSISVDSVFFKKYYKTDIECSEPDNCPEIYEDVELPVHVEYFEDGSNTKEKTWEIDAGISLMGGWSRTHKKKSVSIKMREQYQNGRINYPLFPTNKNVTKYKSFNLRNNGNRFVSDYIEDAMGGEILNGSGVDYQHSRQVVVFYNGHYWGIHDMRERFNEHYVESNYGIDASTVESVKHLNDSLDANAGDDKSYRQLLEYVGSTDFSGEDNAEFAKVKTMIDMGEYIDYMAAQIYARNGDWPNNNVRAWRSVDRPWKFMVYDLDHGFGWKWGVNNGQFNDETNMFEWIEQGGGNKSCYKSGCFANFFIQFSKNPDFERMFINRSCAMWGGYLNASRVKKVVDQMVSTIPESEKDRDLEKFKQNEKYYPDGFDWKGEHLKSWAESRDPQVISEYKKKYEIEGDLVKITLKSEGDGIVLMEGMTLPGTSIPTNYTGKFFSGMEMEIEAVANAGMFTGWSDGVKDAKRKITVEDGFSITAIFK